MNEINRDTQRAKNMSFLALILSIIALVISLADYNGLEENTQGLGTGTTSQTTSTTRTSTSTTNTSLVELNAARLQASTQVAAIRARAVAGQASTQLATELGQVRTTLKAAYDKVGASVSEDFAELDTQLQQLENGLRNGTANVLQGLENLVNALKEEIRTDD